MNTSNAGAFEDHGRASPDSLRLIVLPGLAKDDG
jgi:hypothetical protein